MESLWRLLNLPSQDGHEACHIITVVASRAGSAAADLLSSGDYAIALPQTTILYHGSRIFRELPLTVETTSMLAQLLRATNEKYAMELVRKIESRFMFRFLFSNSLFEDVRKKNAPNPMTDTECFLTLVQDSLSDRAKKLFQSARDRYGRYEKLLKTAQGKKDSRRKNVAKLEASRLKAIVDFELEDNKNNKGWTFSGGGMTRLTDDFFLLNEHLESAQSDRLKQLCSQWGMFSLAKAEQEEIEKAPELDRPKLLIEKVRPLLEPLWAFFVALCHALQEGENELTAKDAFWLGLIDEVIGEKDLTCYRLVAEYKEDPPPPPAAEPPKPQEEKPKDAT
jgi:hypothetical protein